MGNDFTEGVGSTGGFVQGWQDVVLPKLHQFYLAFVQGWTSFVGLLVVTFNFFIFSRLRFRGWTLKRPALHKALTVARHCLDTLNYDSY
jgi:hypothetical protein